MRHWRSNFIPDRIRPAPPAASTIPASLISLALGQPTERPAIEAHTNRLAPRGPAGDPAHRPEPVLAIVGDTIREVRIWTEEEWEQTPAAERPSPAEHLPGLGWVGAVGGHRSD
jgi:hypothetical protein